MLGACDVRTRFTDAAEVFGPQKGASDAHIRLLTGRLERLVQVYEERYGVDVSAMDRAGAAGGLAGGLAARGAQLVDGVDLVAEEVRLDEHLAGADLELDIDELEDGLHRLGWSKENARQLFMSLDADKRSGTIDPEEFQNLSLFANVHAMRSGSVAT